jgi:hypothetical protein
MIDIYERWLEAVPLLGPVLAWSFAFLVVTLVLTLPAYFMFWPFFNRARRQSAEYLERLSERLHERRVSRYSRLYEAAGEFLGDTGLLRVGSAIAGQWAGIVSSVILRLKRLRRGVGKAARALASLDRRVAALLPALRNADLGQQHALPELGDAPTAVESSARVRVAWLALVPSLTILIAMILANSGFTSKILEDLGIVPVKETVGGFRLSYLFAMVLALVTTALGVAHGATRSDDPDKIALAPWGFMLLALGIGGVSGFFFSRIAPPTATFTVPLLGYEMLQGNMLYLFGFALEVALFGLGFVAYEAAATILRGSTTGALGREFRKLAKRHDAYSAAVRNSEEALQKAKVLAADADRNIHGPALNAASVRETIEEAVGKLETVRAQPPQWSSVSHTALTASEVHQIAQKAGLWLIFALAGSAAMTATGLTCLSFFALGLDRPLVWLLSFIQGVVFFAAGLLLGAGETVVRAGKGETQVVSDSPMSHMAGYALIAILTGVYLVVLFGIARMTGLMTVWALNLLVGLFLAAAGHQLSPCLNVLRLFLWRVWNVVVTIFEALWLGLMRLVHGVVLVLEQVFYLLATPLERMFGGRGGGGRPPETRAMAAHAGADAYSGGSDRDRPRLQ